jgi:hypothetical protein
MEAIEQQSAKPKRTVRKKRRLSLKGKEPMREEPPQAEPKPVKQKPAITKMLEAAEERMISGAQGDKISYEALVYAIAACQHFVKWHSGIPMRGIDALDPTDEDIAFYARFCRFNVIKKELIMRSNVIVHNTIVAINRKRARLIERSKRQTASSDEPKNPRIKNAKVKCFRLKAEHADYHAINAKKVSGSTRALQMFSTKLNSIRSVLEKKDMSLNEEHRAISEIKEIVS